MIVESTVTRYIEKIVECFFGCSNNADDRRNERTNQGTSCRSGTS